MKIESPEIIEDMMDMAGRKCYGKERYITNEISESISISEELPMKSIIHINLLDFINNTINNGKRKRRIQNISERQTQRR